MKAILKISAGCILFFLVGAVLLMRMFFTVNEKEQSNQELQFPAGSNGKNALVLYQESRFGLTGKVANLVCLTLQDDGYTVTANHPRQDSPYCVQDYDVVALLSPVYAGQIAKPLLQFAENQDFAQKKVLILLTGADPAETSELDTVKKSVHGAAVLSAAKVNQADQQVADTVREWISPCV